MNRLSSAPLGMPRPRIIRPPVNVTARVARVEPTVLQRLNFTILIAFLFMIFSRVLDLYLYWLHLPCISYRLVGIFLVITGSFLVAFRESIGRYMLAFTACFLVSIPFGIWRGGSIHVLTDQWLMGVVVFTATASLISDFGQYIRTAKTIALAILVLAIISITLGTMENGRLFLERGRFANPNEMAQALLLGMPFWWALYMSFRSPVSKLFAGGSLALMLYVIAKTGSRGALISVVIIVAFMFFRASIAGKVKLLLAVVILLALAIVTLPGGLKARYQTFFSQDDVDTEAASANQSPSDSAMLGSAMASSNSRKDMLIRSLVITLHHPILGVGPGNFPVEENAMAKAEGKRRGAWLGTHNIFTEVSSECGIPALFFYVGIVVLSLTKTYSLYRRTKPYSALKQVGSYALGLHYSLIAFVVTGMFLHAAYTALLPVLAGLTVSLVRTAEPLLPPKKPVMPTVIARARQRLSLARSFRMRLVLALFFGLLLLWIRPQYGGDPADYAKQAYAFLTQPSLAATRGLFEFGHLVWRPAAVAMTVLCGKAISAWTHIDPPLVPLAALIALNAIFSLVAFLLIYNIACRLSGSIAGAVVALLFVTTNAVLTYLRSGYSYLPGLAMQVLAVSIILVAPVSSRLGLRAFFLGCVLAASICLWVPYIVTVPGVIVLAVLWEKGGLRLAVLASFWLVAITGLAFGGAILLNDFRSWQQIAGWIRDSSHEWAQTRRLARLVTGLPRSLLALQDETIMLKRLYLHDPYAPVTWRAILTAVAWKPPLFALAMGALGWILAKTEEGRRLLIANLCAWIPLVAFSVVVFEPGSPSRFLPGFALLFAGLAYVAGRISWQAPAAWLVGSFFVAMVALNLSSVAPAARKARDQNAVARLEAYSRIRKPNDVLVLLGFRDPIFRFQNVDPFHPFSQAAFRVLDAIEPGTLRGQRFSQVFAGEADNAWRQGGDIWISRRLIAERPRPEWDWVEGDTPGVGWRDLSAYYRQFATDAETGGEDGFLRITASPGNRLLLAPYTKSW